MQNLDAVKSDGSFYTIKKTHKSVDDYKNGKCTVNNKGWFKQAFYQQQSDGSYKKLKPDYIVFPCYKN